MTVAISPEQFSIPWGEIHTNFAGAIGIAIHEHSAPTILCHGALWPTEQVWCEGLARLHSLHGIQLAHGLRDVVAVLTIVDALLVHHLDLGASTA